MVTMVLAFVGCGKKTDVAEDGTYDGEVYPENGLPKNKKVKIRAIYPVAGHGKEHFEYAVKTFEERFPNITVEVRYIDAGLEAYRNIVRSLLQAGDENEIYDWLYEAELKLVMDGKFEPQDELWERSFFDQPESKLKDVIKVDEREVYSADGRIYRLPNSLLITGLFYNKRLFRDYGIEQPKNWLDFVKACEKIKKQGVYPMVMDGKHAENYFSFGWGTVPFAVGGKKYIDDVYYYKPDLYISKAYVTYLERLEEFAKKGYIHPGTASFDHTQSQMEFLQGKAAMITNGTWIANEMKDVAPADFEWGFMPFPGNAPGQKRILSAPSSGTGYIWKNKPTLVKQWVKEFNLWLLNLDVQQIFARNGGIPSRSDFVEQEEMVTSISPSVRIALEALNEPDVLLIGSARSRVVSNVEMAKVHKKQGDCYIALITGKMSAKEAAKEINDQYMKGLALEER